MHIKINLSYTHEPINTAGHRAGNISFAQNADTLFPL